MDITVIDNSAQVLAEFEATILRALERCGLQGEGYAKDLCPVDTGELEGSISHAVAMDEKAVYIGTNVEHGPYVEFGTGKYVAGGRSTPWFYVDAKGQGHWTSGSPAQPFLKPAVAGHAGTYNNILKDELKG